MLHPTLKPSHTEDGASHPSAQWRFHFVRIDSCGDSSGFPPDSLLSLRGTLLRVYETIRIWTIFILKQGLTFDNYEFAAGWRQPVSSPLSRRGRLSFIFHVVCAMPYALFMAFNNDDCILTRHAPSIRASSI